MKFEYLKLKPYVIHMTSNIVVSKKTTSLAARKLDGFTLNYFSVL